MNTTVQTDVKPTVRVATTLRSYECESCGPQYCGDARIALPGERTLEANFDDHLGSGTWDGSPEMLYYWCLQALGVAVLVNGEPVDEPCLQVFEGGAWRAVALFQGSAAEATTVNLELVSVPDPQFPDYATSVSVAWMRTDGTRVELPVDREAQGGWDGDVSSIYQRLLEERVHLVLDHRR
jgi:hypothetical protein